MSTINVTNLKHESSGSNNIALDSSGRVGIGTAAPATIVHAEAAQCELQLKSTSGTNSAGLRFVPGGQTNALYIYADGSRNINIDNHATSIASFRASGGLTFNGDTAAANALDDYEEGTWTPVLTSQSGSITSYVVASATYVKIGRVVTCEFVINSIVVGTATGAGFVTGFPFTPANRVAASGYNYQGGQTLACEHDTARAVIVKYDGTTVFAGGQTIDYQVTYRT